MKTESRKESLIQKVKPAKPSKFLSAYSTNEFNGANWRKYVAVHINGHEIKLQLNKAPDNAMISRRTTCFLWKSGIWKWTEMSAILSKCSVNNRSDLDLICLDNLKLKLTSLQTNQMSLKWQRIRLWSTTKILRKIPTITVQNELRGRERSSIVNYFHQQWSLNWN